MSAADIYLGNPNLKKANTKVEFTADNIEEFIKTVFCNFVSNVACNKAGSK